jgi:ABC-type lipoprotein export system ATPase subunit
MASNIVMARHISKIFPLDGQDVIALADVTLDIPQGEFVAIMGPSGSGKSTLLYILGGLDRPTEGAIKIAGQRVDEMNGDELAQFRRDTIGFIFQAFHLVPTITALENVALPGIFAGMPYEERMERAERLLEILSMGERLEHLPRQLSGGQQQRVAIARALFNDPPLIMADEPTGALDSDTGITVLKLLKSLSQRRNKTVIVVTHDPRIADYADRVLHMKDGHLSTAASGE